MFDNQLVNLDIYPTSETIQQQQVRMPPQSNQLNSSANGVSIESLNSASNSRRRQLPQIPLEKQRENRDKGKKF